MCLKTLKEFDVTNLRQTHDECTDSRKSSLAAFTIWAGFMASLVIHVPSLLIQHQVNVITLKVVSNHP